MGTACHPAHSSSDTRELPGGSAQNLIHGTAAPAPAILILTGSKFSCPGYSGHPLLYITAQKPLWYACPLRRAHLEGKEKLSACTQGKEPTHEACGTGSSWVFHSWAYIENPSRPPFKITPPKVMAPGTCLMFLNSDSFIKTVINHLLFSSH